MSGSPILPDYKILSLLTKIESDLISYDLIIKEGEEKDSEFYIIRHRKCRNKREGKRTCLSYSSSFPWGGSENG